MLGGLSVASDDVVGGGDQRRTRRNDTLHANRYLRDGDNLVQLIQHRDEGIVQGR